MFSLPPPCFLLHKSKSSWAGKTVGEGGSARKGLRGLIPHSSGSGLSLLPQENGRRLAWRRGLSHPELFVPTGLTQRTGPSVVIVLLLWVATPVCPNPRSQVTLYQRSKQQDCSGGKRGEGAKGQLPCRGGLSSGFPCMPSAADAVCAAEEEEDKHSNSYEVP